MFIKIEETPNPETLKFLPGEVFFKGNPIEFKTICELQNYRTETTFINPDDLKKMQDLSQDDFDDLSDKVIL